MAHWYNEKWLSSNCFLYVLILSSFIGTAQYAPSADMAGTTAVHADSSAFVAWASSCDYQAGPQDISDSSFGYAQVGDEESVLGKATGLTVLSLGDGGIAVVQFSSPIKNGTGPDFAVFENSFSHDFLELAYVEVSSDGINFVRFPASSLTPTSSQVGSFGTLDASKINNLAGKYMGNYGTPFDLEELKGSPLLNVEAVTHVKIIDVVGSIDAQYASRDTAGNIINDPWPTAFGASGFDLDAVGVINSVSLIADDFYKGQEVVIYPNPASFQFTVSTKSAIQFLEVLDFSGRVVVKSESKNVDVSSLPNGLYVVLVSTTNKIYKQVITVHHE